MKKIIFAFVLFLVTAELFAQTEGISYQAVIIGPDKQELPGEDAKGNILPNADIAIRFSIIDGANNTVYQEVQKTHTDQFGRINLLIGSVNHDAFTQLDWDGTAKDLKVEIDFKGGNNFVDMSREQLKFIPYAYHRNITARGTLMVDGKSDLNGELQVQGPVNLNSSLNVNDSNATNLSGSLTVGGLATLDSGVKVKGTTTLDSLDIAGDMKVAGVANFAGPAIFKVPTEFNSLNVNGLSKLNGQVTVDANMDSVGDKSIYNAYPLLVQGSKQGIAIKVNGSRGNANNFISFWDQSGKDATVGTMWGRIEGVSDNDLENSDAYIQGRHASTWAIASAYYDYAKSVWEAGLATLEVIAASTSSTVCAGLGACVTAPIPSEIFVKAVSLTLKIADAVLAGVNLGKAIAERVQYDSHAKENIGVTYASGSGDYAEWLPKLNTSENFTPGELVGIKNGLVTKEPWGAGKVMIVSTRPIVLGNMPQMRNEKDNVKIAFMGQVPVKVLGAVTPGDYILPDILGNGFAKAVHPKDMEIKDYKKIAGVAWNTIDKINDNLSLVNVAVGVNTNDLSEVVDKQEEKIKALQLVNDSLKSDMEKSNAALATLVPGYAAATGFTKKPQLPDMRISGETESNPTINNQVVQGGKDNVLYFKLSNEQIGAAIDMARKEYQEMLNDPSLENKFLPGNKGISQRNSNNTPDTTQGGITLMPIAEHPFWSRIDSDPSYKEEIIGMIQDKLDEAYQNMKKNQGNFTNLKMR